MTDTSDAEARMRAALDRLPRSASSPTHRTPRHFARDGDVQVEIVNRRNRLGEPSSRVAELEKDLAAERQSRAAAEQLVQQLREQASRQAEQARQAEHARDEAIAARDAAIAARDQAIQRSTQAATERQTSQPPPARKAAAPASTDKPVEWWLPNWRKQL